MKDTININSTLNALRSLRRSWQKAKRRYAKQHDLANWHHAAAKYNCYALAIELINEERRKL